MRYSKKSDSYFFLQKLWGNSAMGKTLLPHSTLSWEKRGTMSPLRLQELG
jgi:hypothetical protein